MAMEQYGTAVVKRPFSQLRWNILILFAFLMIVQSAIFIGIIFYVWGETYDQWLPELLIGIGVLFLGAVASVLIINFQEKKGRKLINRAIQIETEKLQLSYSHFELLQSLAATASKTLSVERVIQTALDIFALTLNDLGIKDEDQVVAAYMYDGAELVLTDERLIPKLDKEKRLAGKQGAIGQAIHRSEVTSTREAADDPELSMLKAFKESKEVICIPLRSGYAVFGVFILGAKSVVPFRDPDIELFSSIADQVVVTLHTDQLGQDLMEEKSRFIKAEETERRLLAKALREGPTQYLARLAMRLGFLRGMLIKNPEQALQELKKLEIGTRRMSEVLRNMVFLLRPMALDGTSLSAAIENAVQQARDKEGTEVRFEGSEFGALLDEDAKPVVRFVIEQGLYDAKEFSQSNRINVGLWRENNLFIARVQDDGKGLDVAAMGDSSNAPQALNLAFLNERAERVSGELAADSTPGVGTTLTLVIPLEKHGRDRTRPL